MSDVNPPGALQVEFDFCEECKGLELGWEMRGDVLAAFVYFSLPDGRKIAACAQFSYPKWTGGYMTPQLRRAAIEVRSKAASLIEPGELEARVAELESELSSAAHALVDGDEERLNAILRARYRKDGGK